MKDRNEFHFTGQVERFARVRTKSNQPMISFMVRCYRETIKVIAFGTVAEQTELSKGDRVECCGRVQNNSWIDQQGQGHQGWQVVAETRADV